MVPLEIVGSWVLAGFTVLPWVSMMRGTEETCAVPGEVREAGACSSISMTRGLQAEPAGTRGTHKGGKVAWFI